MVQDKKQNDDGELLILSDDNDTGSDFVLSDDVASFPETDSNKKSDDFGFGSTTDEVVLDDSKPKVTADLKLGENNGKENDFKLTFDSENSDNSDDGLIIDSSDVDLTPTTEQKTTTIPTGNTSNDNGFNFDLGMGKSSSSSNDDTGTMEDILEETIKKFQSRGEKVDSDIIKVDTEVEDLKSKISLLEGQVKEKDEEKQKLVLEKSAIEKNVKSLEKMKSDSTSVTESKKS